MPCGDCKLEISELTVAKSRKPVVHVTKTLPVVTERTQCKGDGKRMGGRQRCPSFLSEPST